MRKPLLIATAAIGLAAGSGATSALAGSARPGSTVIKSQMNDSVQSRILVDSTGYTLYTWFHGGRSYGSTHDDPSFRPLIAHGRLVAARGSKIERRKLGTRKLPNGQRQVTYDQGEPLYLYHGDARPGQTNGERQQSGKGVWMAVQATSGRYAFPTY
jgi:predicted lipoprotein with Yx(FWY)xxD motif